MRRSGLLLPFLAALACGHTAKPHAAESLPVSADEAMMACVDAVLANSPLIDHVTDPRHDVYPRRRGIVLRNPPSQRSTSLRLAVEPASGTPREMVVEFAWPVPWQGEGGMKPGTDRRTSEVEGEMLTDIGAGLLRELRGQCVPNAPAEPVCSRVAQGRTGRCVVGT